MSEHFYSGDLFYSQNERKETVRRSKQELADANAPMFSLADRESLLKYYTEESKKKRDELPDKYVSATSGFSISSMNRELAEAWSLQRYNGKDSASMTELKGCLTALTNKLDENVTFFDHNDIRTKVDEVTGKYKALIIACESYVFTHKSPRTIAGKARKKMAQSLLSAAVSELDMLHDAAINAFDEAKSKNATADVTLKWDDIVHHGRLRVLDHNRDDYDAALVQSAGRTVRVKHRDTKSQEYITYAMNDEDLVKCRRIVAMDALARKLSVGSLSGGDAMQTRMATMMINGKPVVACVTSGITGTTSSEYYNEDYKIKRPGSVFLTKTDPSYSEAHLKDLLSLPFIDYLCGVKGRDMKDLRTEKTDTGKGTVLGRIIADGHIEARTAFGTDFEPFPEIGDGWMDKELAEHIMGLNEKDILTMMAGVLPEEERMVVAKRLESLKGRIREKLGPDGSYPEETFKTTDSYKQMVQDPVALADKITGMKSHIPSYLDADRAMAGAAIPEEKLPEEGLLVSKKKLMEDIKEAKGKEEEALNKIITEIKAINVLFPEGSTDIAPLQEGKAALSNKLDEKFKKDHDLQAKLREYLKTSKDAKDLPNRLAVGKLLNASIHQENIVRMHVNEMCDWVDKLKKEKSQRKVAISYDELFREAMVIAQNMRRAGEFSISDLYRGMVFSEEELCERTDTESLGKLNERLKKNVKKELEKARKDAGKSEKSRDVKAIDIPDLIDKVIRTESGKVPEGFTAFIGAVKELADTGAAYLKKHDDRLINGTTAHSRISIIEDLLDLLDDEIGTFLEKGEDGALSIKRSEVKRLTDEIVKDGKKKEEITIADLCLMVKKEMLIDHEKGESAGSKHRAEKRLTDAKKRTAYKDEPFFMYSQKMDASLKSRRRNSPEVTLYADKLAELAKIPTMKVFPPEAVREYEKRRKTIKNETDRLNAESVIKNAFADVYGAFRKALDESTDAYNKYAQKQEKKFFGGVLTGQGRLDIMRNVYESGVAVHKLFTIEGKDKKLLINHDLMMQQVDILLKSGMKYEDITFMDIIVQTRKFQAEEAKKQKAGEKKGWNPFSKKKK